jgi:hypothetical protein
VLAFDSFDFSLFSVKVSINRFSVDVIIGKRSVHLRQRQVIDLLDYFLRSGPELVPLTMRRTVTPVPAICGRPP